MSGILKKTLFFRPEPFDHNSYIRRPFGRPENMNYRSVKVVVNKREVVPAIAKKITVSLVDIDAFECFMI